ncbi:hypothetical protein ACH4MJ_03065 [Streptomyces anulatus]
MTSADPGNGAVGGTGGGRETGKVESAGTGSPAIGAVGDHATFSWVRGRALTQDAWLLLSAVLVIIATIGFTIFAAVRWPGGPESQYVWFYLLVALALLTAVAATLYPATSWTERSRRAVRGGADPRRRRTVRAVLVGVAAFCCAGSVLTWVDVHRTGEVEVELAVREEKANGVFTVTMKPPPSGDVRNKLKLTLIIADKDLDQSPCVGEATAAVTSDDADPNESTMKSESPAEFELGGPERGARFTVGVNLSDEGCPVKLLARGTLHND